ncbi:MAG: hypothetical protein A3K19_09470 [Lentisphaerae bacterium RIFOXYB12_FULL_65_16]|nr:MAG: hypothetical protein A3K18_03490 [Lentisphaerae bacterium RIFOXYA12_64_32]OGV90480.1 MAG: hypothetical protein A3K19_09470 [Lentisphaerae bacterium RIFOXYB12_FULL_65_16]
MSGNPNEALLPTYECARGKAQVLTNGQADGSGIPATGCRRVKMYWYYKYPLYVLAAVVAFGIVYLGWTRLSGNVAPAEPPSVTAPENPPTSVQPPGSTPVADVPPKNATGPKPPAEPGKTDDTSAGGIQRRIEAADAQLRAENLMAARTLVQKVMADPAVKRFDANWFKAAEVLSRVNTVVANSNAPAPEKTPYIVKEGDNLVKIAYRLHTTVGALQRLNGLDAANPVIFPGNVLYVLNCKWQVLVIKSKFVLLLMDGENLFKLYRVGIGKQDRTPVGAFEINSKVREPAWTPPGKNIPYGHPDNVLGTHWLGLVPVEGTDVTLKGYGIHGTWEPQSIGTAASLGCVRMRNEDVGELFDILPVNVKVVIREE